MRDLPDEIELPKPLPRTRRGGGQRGRFDVCLRTVTPILGGAARTRTCDEVDVIRIPTIRGHLRFWWRALRAHCFGQPADLYEEEARIWGRAGDHSGGRGRSPVELRVEITRTSEIDCDAPHGEGAYALWPARGNQHKGVPTAPRRRPGLEFRLTVSAPSGDLAQVRDAVRLWIMFGGYGSRTRRGLGALTVCGDTSGWLPSATCEGDLIQSLDKLFRCSLGGRSQSSGSGLFSMPPVQGWTPNSVPVLAGASFLVKLPANDESSTAWLEALDRLRDFRQGAQTNGSPARKGRRGRSLWPEADMVRWLTGRPGGGHRHSPRPEHLPPHVPPPLWPRAGFGLPIEIQFAPRDRAFEPSPTQLIWRDHGQNDHDRLASSLVVKPLPVQGGFLPMTLWLNRAAPGGDVFARQFDQQHKRWISITHSCAPFSPFAAPLFDPANGKSSLRDAFCDWLGSSPNSWTKL